MPEEMPEIDAMPSEDVPPKADDRISVSGKLAICICVAYFLPGCGLHSGFPVGMALWMGMWSASLLVLYVGIPLAFLLWVLIIIYRVIVRKNRRGVIWTGIKYGIIVFGIMGLGFWMLGMVPPTAQTFTLGYWIQAKVWVDVDDVRKWTKEYKRSDEANERIPRVKWPTCLASIPLGRGQLLYDPEISSVTLVEGSGHGHWGLTVAPKGTPLPDYWCVMRLEDGAWVWHDH